MPRTLADLENEIRWMYDIEGLTNRHSQAAIFRRINVNYRTLRDRLTTAGCTLFLTSTEFQQTVSGRSVGYNGTVLTGAVMGRFCVVKEVSVLDGQSWIPLRASTQMESDWVDDGSSTGMPQAWSEVGVTPESGLATNGQYMMALVWPALDVPRTFRVKGLQTWVDLTQPTDIIQDALGVLDWVIAAVGCDLVGRDDDVALAQARFADRDQKYADILKRARARQPSNVRRINVRARGYR